MVQRGPAVIGLIFEDVGAFFEKLCRSEESRGETSALQEPWKICRHLCVNVVYENRRKHFFDRRLRAEDEYGEGEAGDRGTGDRNESSHDLLRSSIHEDEVGNRGDDENQNR